MTVWTDGGAGEGVVGEGLAVAVVGAEDVEEEVESESDEG